MATASRQMIRAGLLTEEMTRGGLDQRWQTPPPSGVPAMAARLASVPGVAVKMLPMLARGQLLRSTGARHPDDAGRGRARPLGRPGRAPARLATPLSPTRSNPTPPDPWWGHPFWCTPSRSTVTTCTRTTGPPDLVHAVAPRRDHVHQNPMGISTAL